MAHVDDFIWGRHRQHCYARMVLMIFRLPAVQQLDWREWLGQYKLFCTYQGKRYRVTGASRLGDLYLHPDFNKDPEVAPYAEPGFRGVDPEECSDWSDRPEPSEEAA